MILVPNFRFHKRINKSQKFGSLSLDLFEHRLHGGAMTRFWMNMEWRTCHTHGKAMFSWLVLMSHLRENHARYAVTGPDWSLKLVKYFLEPSTTLALLPRWKHFYEFKVQQIFGSVLEVWMVTSALETWIAPNKILGIANRVLVQQQHRISEFLYMHSLQACCSSCEIRFHQFMRNIRFNFQTAVLKGFAG